MDTGLFCGGPMRQLSLLEQESFSVIISSQPEKSQFIPDSPLLLHQKQNLLNALYIGYRVEQTIDAHPVNAALQKAYMREVIDHSSSTDLAKLLSKQMRADSTMRKGQIAQEAVNRIEALPLEIIKTVSDIIDAGLKEKGSKYRYPAFEILLQQATINLQGE